MVGYRYIFYGYSAHAAAAPEKGINALDGVIQLFVGINALRQHLKDDVRIHGIITDGGKAPNVVPDYAAANFMLRSHDHSYLREIVEKVRHIAEGAALITGTRLEIEPLYPFYEELRPNLPLNLAFGKHARRLGFIVEEPPRKRVQASTDFGNISQVTPAAAFSYATSPEPVAFHTPAMTAVARSGLAQERTLAAAKVLALTARDLLTDAGFLAQVQADFTARTQS